MNASRVEKDFWHCEQIQPAKMNGALFLGLEQARDTILPQVHLHRRLKPFAEDTLPSLLTDSEAWLAHPASLRDCPSYKKNGKNISQHISLAIGPRRRIYSLRG